MFKAIAVLAMLVVGSGAAQADDPYNLVCSVTGWWGHRDHTLRVEDSSLKSVMGPVFGKMMGPSMRLLQNGSFDLTVESFGQDRIVAVLKQQVGNWPAGTAQAKYTIDRITAGVKIDYLGPDRMTPTKILFAELFATETGTCQKMALRF